MTGFYMAVDGTLADATAVNQFALALSGQADVPMATFAPISPPPAPTVAVGASPGGLSGDYQYVIAYVTGIVQGPGVTTLYPTNNTGIGVASTPITISANGSANLTAIPLGPTGVIARQIGRTIAGQTSPFYLVAQLNDNTTTEYLDVTSDSQLGAALATSNTTGTSFTFNDAVTMNRALVAGPNNSNFHIAPLSNQAVGFTNTAQSAWGLKVLDNSAGNGIPITSTYYNTLDDGSGNMDIAGLLSSTGGVVTPYGTQAGAAAVQVGANSDFNGNSFALGIAAPGGTGTWPFGVVMRGGSNGVRTLSVDNTGVVRIATTLLFDDTGNAHIVPASGGNVGFTNNAQSLWGLRVQDGSSPSAYTMNNTLDDGSGNMTVAGSATVDGSLAVDTINNPSSAYHLSINGNGNDVQIASTGGYVGFTNSGHSAWEFYLDTITNELYAVAPLNVSSNFVPSTVSNTGGGKWVLGAGAWGGNAPATTNVDSVTGIGYIGGTGSQLFTFSSEPGQASLQLDGSIFIGDNIGYNPFGTTGATDGGLVVANTASFGNTVNFNVDTQWSGTLYAQGTSVAATNYARGWLGQFYWNGTNFITSANGNNDVSGIFLNNSGEVDIISGTGSGTSPFTLTVSELVGMSAMKLTTAGAVTTRNNTLDDGSGNMTTAGGATVGAIVAAHSGFYVYESGTSNWIGQINGTSAAGNYFVGSAIGDLIIRQEANTDILLGFAGRQEHKIRR